MGERKPKQQSGTCIEGLGYLAAAFAIIMGVFILRPAPVSTFARVLAWRSLGQMVPVRVEDGNGEPVTAHVFVIDEGPANRAPPLVFVHGFPTSSFDWKDVWPYMCREAHRRCIAIDLLGYGLSDKPVANYTVAMHS